jgi:hypothetical protein
MPAKESTAPVSVKGYLLVTMEPPPALLEEFNDWYDLEHVPERLRVRGFESARRFVCLAGWPRYMAFYDLGSVDVIRSPGYKAIANENFSPWTKRMLSRVHGFYRSFGEQIVCEPTAGVAARMLLLRVSGMRQAREVELKHTVLELRDKHPNMLGTRLLSSEQPIGDHMILIESSGLMAGTAPALIATLEGLGGRLECVNEYALHTR